MCDQLSVDSLAYPWLETFFHKMKLKPNNPSSVFLMEDMDWHYQGSSKEVCKWRRIKETGEKRTQQRILPEFLTDFYFIVLSLVFHSKTCLLSDPWLLQYTSWSSPRSPFRIPFINILSPYKFNSPHLYYHSKVWFLLHYIPQLNSLNSSSVSAWDT